MIKPVDNFGAAVEALTAKGQFFEVENREVNSVMYSVYKNIPESMREFFEWCTEKPERADSTFLVSSEKRYSFSETMTAAAQFGSALVENFGVVKGDRIAIAMRNNPEWIFAYIGAISIGAVVVPMNAWWTSKELRYGLEDSGARVVICDPQRSGRISSYVDELDLTVVVVSDEDLAGQELRFDDVIASHVGKAMPKVVVRADDDAAIMYTSGSTGHPKGAVSTHRAILTAIASWLLMGHAEYYANKNLHSSTAVDERSADDQPAALVSVPLFHTTGSHGIFLMSMTLGRKMVMMYKWDVENAMQLIERERITYFNGVPSMSAELQAAAQDGRYDLSSLSSIVAGGAARPPEQLKKLNSTFKGSPGQTSYALTETNALGTVISGVDYQQRPTSVGRVTPAVTEIKIIDSEGRTLEANECGEICIKSPSNVRGYWNSPEATAKSFVDGWLHTGDVGYFDEEGFLFIVDRIKEIIIRGGENISCLEVEAAIYEHPSVEEAVVFGFPDEKLGELVAAVIVLSADGNLDEETFRDGLSKRLAAFKVPAYIWFRDEKLPRIASGKFSKRQIKDEYCAASL